jgi:hypothetical protein
MIAYDGCPTWGSKNFANVEKYVANGVLICINEYDNCIFFGTSHLETGYIFN